MSQPKQVTARSGPYGAITAHAMRRWLERVEGLAWPEDTGGSDMLGCAFLARAGLCDLAECARKMLTPNVRSVLRMGKGNVINDRWVIVIERGQIVTVLTHRMRHVDSAMRHASLQSAWS